MRFLFLILSFCFSLIAIELTEAQLELAKSSGFSQNDIDKATSSKIVPEKSMKKEQIITNLVVREAKKEDAFDRYASQFFNNKNIVNPYSMPTPTNYILNYGDKLSINIFGALEEKFNLSINNNGNIVIPRVGELKLIGLSYAEAKKFIMDETKKAYPNSTNILVDISEFTSIQVTIAGLVNTPGLYNLTSFSTMKDALLSSGGILNSGSYRNIQLKRNGKVIKTFDLYSLIRYGKNDSDINLKSGDIIIVNPVKKEVLLKGLVKNQAIYELKNNESFRTLISLASGLKAKANKNAIKLKRYTNNSIKVYTLSLDELYSMSPINGDEIQIFSLSNQNANLVSISGNILIPGEKELPKDKKLSTLLKNELQMFGQNGFFKADTNYDYALIKNLDDRKNFNLQKILDKKTDVLLKSGDEIIILNRYSNKSKPYVFLQGDIVNDGNNKVEFYEDLEVRDLFDIVRFKTEKNGQAYHVDKTKVQLVRLENNEKKTLLIDVEKNPNFKIKEYDEIRFFDFFVTNEVKRATIKGQIFIPGTYNITSGMTINELVKIAGGFTKKTLFTRCELARYEIKNNERVRSILTLDLKKAMDLKIEIKEDDELTIFAIDNWNDKRYVTLSGEIKYPGTYSIAEGEKLANVISRAGGYTDYAFVEGSVFSRDEVRRLKQKRINESLDRLRKKVIVANASANEAGEKASDKDKMAAAVFQLEQQASNNKVIGRISLDLYYDLNRFANSSHNITLKDKDSLYIPSINDTISVVGEVLNENTFIYDKELDVNDYLEKAGGISETADEEFIYIVKANGEASRVKTDYFWGNSNEVFKGDTVVVPLKIDVLSDITFAKDVTAIMYQLAVTAASVKTVGGF